MTGALSVVILPEAAALAATGKWDDLRIRVNESLVFIFLITVLFYALFVVLGETYGELLFKDPKAGRFVAISAGMVVPAALSGLVNTTLNSLGEEKKVFLIFLIASVFLVASILFLPRLIGIYALSVGECSFHLCEFVLGMVVLWKKRGYDGRIFKPAAIIMTFAFPTVLAAKLASMLTSDLGMSVLFRAAIPTAFGVLIYAGLILVFKPIPTLKALFFKRKKQRTGTSLITPPLRQGRRKRVNV